MSRKFIVAIAAVAALGMSTLVASDAFARAGGYHGGGGSHRGSVHRHTTMPRTVTRTHTRTNKHAGRPNVHRHKPHHPHRPHHVRRHHGHHWYWCRHHPARCGGGTWVDVVGAPPVSGPPVTVVATAPRPVVSAPPAVCTNDCDYFVKDEPGCYMAKRAFSTPIGDELRCVKICDEPTGDGKRAEK
jgi:hypothetical protein